MTSVVLCICCEDMLCFTLEFQFYPFMQCYSNEHPASTFSLSLQFSSELKHTVSLIATSQCTQTPKRVLQNLALDITRQGTELYHSTRSAFCLFVTVLVIRMWILIKEMHSVPLPPHHATVVPETKALFMRERRAFRLARCLGCRNYAIWITCVCSEQGRFAHFVRADRFYCCGRKGSFSRVLWKMLIVNVHTISVSCLMITRVSSALSPWWR